MSARIIPFPRSRNFSFVLKHARYIASINQHAGERYLIQQLDVQAATMRRRGVEETWIQQERQQLEAAIRVALWHLIMRQPGGAA
jgi:hypothetical protein